MLLKGLIIVLFPGSDLCLLLQGIVHGDIRCRNIYVAEHSDSVFKVGTRISQEGNQ
jgi:hypothetical protein